LSLVEWGCFRRDRVVGEVGAVSPRPRNRRRADRIDRRMPAAVVVTVKRSGVVDRNWSDTSPLRNGGAQ
jgi:hypothetical protein